MVSLKVFNSVGEDLRRIEQAAIWDGSVIRERMSSCRGEKEAAFYSPCSCQKSSSSVVRLGIQ